MNESNCVVLVPVQNHLEPACEAALKQLEARGYEVRRVRGFAAVDQGRNQMATDALAQGFDETMWIDADVAFDADAVEKLRAHELPICGAIYPKKGVRALAVHVLPGTEKIVFGAGGGLLEVRYAAAGFLHVRREAYEKIQRDLQLPVCNERFGPPMVPYFQPLAIPDGPGHWYLAEDFAFCERARQCGYRIMVDTTIRLRHIGSYAYSWEDAGKEMERYGTFHFNLSRSFAKRPLPSLPAQSGSDESLQADDIDARLDELSRAHPWPAAKPNVEPKPNQGWLFPATREMLRRAIAPDHRVIVELGSFLGLSTRFMADLAPRAKVVAVDHWKGSAEHRRDPQVAGLLPTLYETFLVNCWDYRDRVIPLRMNTLDGLRELVRNELQPDVIFVDADHSYEAVKDDVQTALELFPNAILLGDDWDWDDVRRAVTAVAQQRGRDVDVQGNAWQLILER